MRLIASVPLRWVGKIQHNTKQYNTEQCSTVQTAPEERGVELSMEEHRKVPQYKSRVKYTKVY